MGFEIYIFIFHHIQCQLIAIIALRTIMEKFCIWSKLGGDICKALNVLFFHYYFKDLKTSENYSKNKILTVLRIYPQNFTELLNVFHHPQRDNDNTLTVKTIQNKNVYFETYCLVSSKLVLISVKLKDVNGITISMSY